MTGLGILKFIKEHVDTDGSLLITDEHKAYNAVNPVMRRAVIKHAAQYVDGETHTNTIEGFWSLVKRAWFGSHHHYTRKYLPLYIIESCWKHNNRDNDNAFGTLLQVAMA